MFNCLPCPAWMGIINLTPDSFSDGGLYTSIDAVVDKCREMVHAGAHILDFGGVSTHPAASPFSVSYEEELARLYAPLKAVRKALPPHVLLSVDTFSPKIAATLAQEKLFDIINDVFAASQTQSIQGRTLTTADIAASYNLGLIVMHSGPLNPQQSPSKETDPLFEMKDFFQERLAFCKQRGVTHIAIDPGIGGGYFGKSFADIQCILQPHSVTALSQLGAPLLIGVSRKKFLEHLDPTLTTPHSRDRLTKEIEFQCIKHGSHIIRTHKMP